MALRDIFFGEWSEYSFVAVIKGLTQNHLQDGNTNSNCQVYHDGTTLFSSGDGDCIGTGDVVQTAVDAERSGGDGNVYTDDKTAGC